MTSLKRWYGLSDWGLSRLLFRATSSRTSWHGGMSLIAFVVTSKDLKVDLQSLPSPRDALGLCRLRRNWAGASHFRSHSNIQGFHDGDVSVSHFLTWHVRDANVIVTIASMMSPRSKPSSRSPSVSGRCSILGWLVSLSTFTRQPES